MIRTVPILVWAFSFEQLWFYYPTCRDLHGFSLRQNYFGLFACIFLGAAAAAASDFPRERYFQRSDNEPTTRNNSGPHYPSTRRKPHHSNINLNPNHISQPNINRPITQRFRHHQELEQPHPLQRRRLHLPQGFPRGCELSLGTSPFCTLFTEQEWLDYVYSNDPKYYADCAFGLSTGRAYGIGYLGMCLSLWLG